MKSKIHEKSASELAKQYQKIVLNRMSKTKLIASALGIFLAGSVMAQDRTTVNAMNAEISDNLDLRAVASIFGDSQNLDDFEKRLNDPNTQISNLDLNNDNRVDYLRVIESVEGNTHLIVIQSVLGLDTFQDVATVEVERDRNNQVSVQVVGDVYMYGANYIYEPVYVSPPVIYTSFWVGHYRPYCSAWRWGYYPSYYVAWNPFPVFRYRNHVNVYINFSHHYNYVNVRRSHVAVAMYAPRRANYCEVRYPTRSFAYRNTNVRNRYELDQTRNTRSSSTRNQVAYSNAGNAAVRNNGAMRNPGNVRGNSNPVRTYGSAGSDTGVRTDTRDNGATRENNSVRNEGTRNSNAIRTYGNTNQPGNVRSNAPIRENGNDRNEGATRGNSNPVRNFSTPRPENSVRMNPNMGRNENRGGANNRIESARANNNSRAGAPQQNAGRNDTNGRGGEQRGARR